MALTVQEIENIANQTLDFYIKNEIGKETIQDKPLLKALRAKQKTFPGGKEYIRGNVKGDYTTEFMGYSHDDTVSYSNPANVKQFEYPWRELHAGIELSATELKKAGFTIADTTTGERAEPASQRELVAITNLLQDKYEDMDEGTQRSLNTMLWRDGTQDAKEIAGVQAYVTTAPTTGVVAGIDRGANSWWRNRVSLAIAASATNQTLTKTLRSEVRQLRRYGGRPSLWLAGSAFIEALEDEIQAKGTYTQTGFGDKSSTDISMAEISIKGIGTVMYDPTLDDLSKQKYAYVLDERAMQLHVMDGEDMKMHYPARPHDKYVFYRAMTLTAGLIFKRFTSSGVYSIA